MSYPTGASDAGGCNAENNGRNTNTISAADASAAPEETSSYAHSLENEDGCYGSSEVPDTNMSRGNQARASFMRTMQKFHTQDSPELFTRRVENSLRLLEGSDPKNEEGNDKDEDEDSNSELFMTWEEFFKNEPPPEALRYVDHNTLEDQKLGLLTIYCLLRDFLAKPGGRDSEEPQESQESSKNLCVDSAISLLKRNERKEIAELLREIAVPGSQTLSCRTEKPSPSADTLASFPLPPGHESFTSSGTDPVQSTVAKLGQKLRKFSRKAKKTLQTKKTDKDGDSDDDEWDFKCRGEDPSLGDEAGKQNSTQACASERINDESISFKSSAEPGITNICGTETGLALQIPDQMVARSFSQASSDQQYLCPSLQRPRVPSSDTSVHSQARTIKPPRWFIPEDIEEAPELVAPAPKDAVAGGSTNSGPLEKDALELAAAETKTTAVGGATESKPVEPEDKASELVSEVGSNDGGEQKLQGVDNTESATKARTQPINYGLSILQPLTSWGTREYAPPGYGPVSNPSGNVIDPQTNLPLRSFAASTSTGLGVPPTANNNSLRERVANILPRMSFLSLADPISSTDLELSSEFKTPDTEAEQPESSVVRSPMTSFGNSSQGESRDSPKKSEASGGTPSGRSFTGLIRSAKETVIGTFRSSPANTPTRQGKTKSKEELSPAKHSSSFDKAEATGVDNGSDFFEEVPTVKKLETDLRTDFGLSPVFVKNVAPHHQKHTRHDYEWYHKNLWCYMCTPDLYKFNLLPKVEGTDNAKDPEIKALYEKSLPDYEEAGAKAPRPSSSVATITPATATGAQFAAKIWGLVQPKHRPDEEIVGPLFCDRCREACCVYSALKTCIGAAGLEQITSFSELSTNQTTIVAMKGPRLPGCGPSMFSLTEPIVDQVKEIESFYREGPDVVRNFQRCTNCDRRVCPKCCGRCSIPLCGCVVCTGCMHNFDEAKYLNRDTWRCIWHETDLG